MLQHIRPAVVLLVLFSALTGLLYPLAVTGVGATRAPAPGERQPDREGRRRVGSALIGQNFTSDRYFHPRPSATTDTDPNDSTKTIDAPYNAANSSRLESRADVAEAGRPGQGRRRGLARKAGSGPVPADAVTTSASGLDPDISPENALRRRRGRQGARPRRSARARAGRGLNRAAGVRHGSAKPRVNVLRLNLALDRDKVVVVTTRGS